MVDNTIKTQKYLAGHVLFREGDLSDNCYLVREGELALSRIDSKGKTRKFAKVEKGEIVGEMSMIGDTPRTATVTISKDA